MSKRKITQAVRQFKLRDLAVRQESIAGFLPDYYLSVIYAWLNTSAYYFVEYFYKLRLISKNESISHPLHVKFRLRAPPSYDILL